MSDPTIIKDPLKVPIKAGHGLVRLLKEYGITKVFGIPDGHTLAFYDGFLHTTGIDHILVNDERTAAFAADAYARVTGTLGVCDAGAAGSMNFPVALAEAKGFGSPVLAIVGQVKSKDMLRNVPHDIKVKETLAPITKWSEKVIVAEHLPRFLNQGIRMATNGKPGPVAVTISEDVMGSEELTLQDFIPKLGGACSINGCRVAAAMGELESAAKMIRNAKQPVIYSGGRAVVSGAFEEIRKLSELLIAPVFSTISGKGIMTNRPDSNYFGTIGLFGEKPNHKFIRKDADLMIVIGSRLTEDDTANFKIPPQRMDMIQIDIDPAEIGLSFNPLGVVGDCKASLQGLLQILENDGISTESNIDAVSQSRKANLTKLRKEHDDYRAKDTATWVTSEPIKPQRVLKTISEVLGANDYLVTDASASARWIGPYYPVKSTGLKIITARGVGPTGFGLGALIGTCVATRELYGIENPPKVVLFTGDGGLMNAGVADLETIVRLKLDCTIVIINNSSLGFVKFGQAMLYKQRYLDTDRPQTNFPAIGQAFGGTGTRVERLADLDATIKTAINAKGLNIVDVITDPQEFLPPNFY